MRFFEAAERMIGLGTREVASREMRAASVAAPRPGCRLAASRRAPARAAAATRWRAVVPRVASTSTRAKQDGGGLARRRPSVRAASSARDEAGETRSDDAPSSSARVSASHVEDSITRAEALRRTDAQLARRPSLSIFLASLDATSRAAGLPPARCVWHNKLWKYAARRWSLPELLAALKAVDGAGFAEVVRLSGARSSAATALGLFREGRALGWCDGDGGAAAAAMAWTHDRARQGAQADALCAPFTPPELAAVLQNLKKGKAGGIDGILPEMLQHLGPRGQTFLQQQSDFSSLPRGGHLKASTAKLL